MITCSKNFIKLSNFFDEIFFIFFHFRTPFTQFQGIVLSPLARLILPLNNFLIRGKVLIGSTCSTFYTLLSCPDVHAFFNYFAGLLKSSHTLSDIRQHNYHVTCVQPHQLTRCFLLSIPCYNYIIPHLYRNVNSFL